MRHLPLIAHEAVKPKLIRTFFYLAFYLIGLNVVLPFVPLGMWPSSDYLSGDTLAGILGAMREKSEFTHNTSILALGVSSYYLATILSVLIIPVWFRNRAGNENAIRRFVRGLTLIIAILQAKSYSGIVSLHFFSNETPEIARPVTWLVLVAGAMICVWIADKISEQGLMDGRILLLCVELCIGFPSALFAEFSNKLVSSQLLLLGIEVVVWFLVIAGLVALTQAIRYIPLKIGEDQKEGTALRVHLNMVDEYPLGLASYFNFLVLLPLVNINPDSALSQMLIPFGNPVSLPGMALTFIIIFLATCMFVAVMLSPRYYAELLDEWNASVPDAAGESLIRDFFRNLFKRLAIPLALIMGLIGILPGLAVLVFDATPNFGAYFGGYSLFLIVSLATDFFNKVEQTATGSSSIVGRSTTPDLDLAYEFEMEEE
jgi:preprotein translocase subunit SecY